MRRYAHRILARGFTLVELLIVIAIIGILVSLGTVSYSSAQMKGRDGRRKADLRAIQNAWEQYYGDNSGVYPDSCASPGTTYLPAGLPTDPKTGVAYTGTCTTSTYCFCTTAALESGIGNASNNACATYGTGNFYCVKNLQ